MAIEEPYQGLKYTCKPPETEESFEGGIQVLHGRRQLVS